MKAVHVAPLHRRGDTRIFLKQCVSLTQAGVEVSCIVADGEGDAEFAGGRILDCGRPPGGKFVRRLVPLYRAVRRARREPHDVIHFHDGMLLPLAIILAVMGHRVIYDVHEDYRQQVLNARFPLPVKKAASLLYAGLEWLGSRTFALIVAATPHIATRFPKEKTISVQNFPLLDELVVHSDAPYSERERVFSYVGGITALRGAEEMVEAVGSLDGDGAALDLVGSFSPPALQQAMEALPGWKRVEFHGWRARADVASLLSASRAGLVLYHPGPNHLESQPNKLFEYMSASLPVIASDFPLWRQIIEGVRCGLLVDPLDTKAIADAMQWMLDHPEEAEMMGRRGRQAVLDIYNWDHEAARLVANYRAMERQ